MKIGFIISVYDKLDDLMVHLEIMQYYQWQKEIIIIYMKDIPERYENIIKKYHYSKIDGINHSLGSLLSCIEGLKIAKKLNLDYVVYRNADDWLFSHKWENNNFNIINGKYLCAGYNWFGHNNFNNFTLNQLYFHVNTFSNNLNEIKNKFITENGLCEYKIANWINNLIKENQFYRLKGREDKNSIGNLMQQSNNNRFFNFQWQLIGAHDLINQKKYWNLIKNYVPYSKRLVRDFHFNRFLTTNNWNKNAHFIHSSYKKILFTKDIPLI